MKPWIFILLMILEGVLAATIPPAHKEFVSIAKSLNSVVPEDDEHGSSVDSKPQALTSARSDHGPVPQTQCESDDDCPASQYCYETKVCAPCLDCSVYFRLPSQTGCSRSPQMCGACVTGYHDEVLSDGRVRDACSRIPTMQPDAVFNAGTTYNTPQMWLFVFFVFVGLLVSIYLVAVWSCRKCYLFEKTFWAGGNGSYMNYTLPSAPPLPSKDADIGRNWAGEPLVSNYELTTILPTKSVPYDTSPAEGCSKENEEGSHAGFFASSSNSAQCNNAVGPSPPELTDELTTPSTWTPDTLSEGSLITSFSGLLSNASSNNNHLPSWNAVGRSEQNTASTFSANTSSFSNDSSSSSTENSQRHHFASAGAVGPVQIVLQGGQGSSSVQCRVHVNNIQINEY